MRFATFSSGDRPRLGVVIEDQIVDLGIVSGGQLPGEMLEFLRAGPSALDRASAAVGSTDAGRLPLASVKLHAPLLRAPRNVFALGWNYAEHIQEGSRARGEERKLPEYPVFFSKVADAITGPDEPIVYDDRVTQQVDWEVELAVVIGREGRNIPKELALEKHVFGYTVGNDVSARDLQWRHGGQWHKGKSLDGFCVLGPWIVTADEVPNAQSLRISARVNGATMQDSNTRHMIFDIPTIIESLSEGLTLRPGDVILTGTPDGVGFARKPPVFLKDGDVVEVEVESLGVLRNRIEARR